MKMMTMVMEGGGIIGLLLWEGVVDGTAVTLEHRWSAPWTLHSSIYLTQAMSKLWWMPLELTMKNSTDCSLFSNPSLIVIFSTRELDWSRRKKRTQQLQHTEAAITKSITDETGDDLGITKWIKYVIRFVFLTVVGVSISVFGTWAWWTMHRGSGPTPPW
jgi:hypothetical protein